MPVYTEHSRMNIGVACADNKIVLPYTRELSNDTQIRRRNNVRLWL